MPVFNFDSQDEDFTSPFRTVPMGWYGCRITSVEERTYTHKETGELRSLWDVTYTCTEPGEEHPFIVKDPLFLTPKAWSRIKALLKALDMPHHGDIKLEAEDLVGRDVAMDLECVVEQYEKEGELKSIEKMKPRGFNPWKPLGALSALQAQDAAMQSKMAQARAKANQKAIDEAAYQAREEERTGAPDLTKLAPQYTRPDPAAGPKQLPQRDTLESIPDSEIPF